MDCEDRDTKQIELDGLIHEGLNALFQQTHKSGQSVTVLTSFRPTKDLDATILVALPSIVDFTKKLTKRRIHDRKKKIKEVMMPEFILQSIVDIKSWYAQGKYNYKLFNSVEHALKFTKPKLRRKESWSSWKQGKRDVPPYDVSSTISSNPSDVEEEEALPHLEKIPLSEVITIEENENFDLKKDSQSKVHGTTNK